MADQRCDHCRRRTGAVAFDCACSRTFCAAHRLPESHACTFDHRAALRAAHAASLVKVVAPKVAQL